jgi:diguanylate cyclase (GGDEF)-like protein
MPQQEWHRQLARQVRRAGVDPRTIGEDGALRSLLKLVSNSYDDADQHRYLSDRAFEISGREMLELNEQLRLAGETELAREHARLHAVFESVAIGLVVVDAAGTIVDLNPTAREMLNVDSRGTPLELRSMVGSAANDPQNDRTFTSLIRAIDRGLPWRGADIMLRVGDDHTFPGSVAFNPLFEDDLPAGGVLAITDVTERHSAATELAWRATHDSLTGLLNRTALMDHLNRILGVGDAVVPLTSDGRTPPIGVLFIDLDRFKLVNDTLGHAAGDDLLTIVVERIRKVMREGDTLARLGGDEFIILCENAAGAAAAMHIAERVVATLSQPVGLGLEQAYISASIGVTVSDDSSDAASLLRDADVALYRAKSSGRSRAVLFNEAMREEVAERVSMERSLREAMDSDGLFVAFQPVYALADGRLTGFECLVRWERDGTPVSPATFVGLAEDTGLIGILGSIVLTKAGEFLHGLAAAGVDDLTVSVNISPHQLGDPVLLDGVAAIIEQTGMSADRLMLEITESALLGASEASLEHLGALQALGVGIALDDFGTGYSSLSTLRTFPLDALKIDRAFVTGLTTDNGDRTIVSAIAAMGHALGMTIIAEGAETQDQLQAVRDLGCDRVQGFVLGRPVDPGAAHRLAIEPRTALWDQAGSTVSAPVFASGK